MKIIYKKGDLLECSEPWILHGCNALGVMGSGVAKAIRAKYPYAYMTYKAAESTHGLNLGEISWSTQEDGKVVFNGITQEQYGKVGKFVDYDAVVGVMQSVAYLVDSWDQVGIEVAMPKIGAGLGGGDWDVIAEIIEIESTNFQPVVYTLDKRPKYFK